MFVTNNNENEKCHVTVHSSTNKRPNAINQSGKTTQRNKEGNMKTDLKEFFSYKMAECKLDISEHANDFQVLDFILFKEGLQ